MGKELKEPATDYTADDVKKENFKVGEHETLCQLCGDFCTFDVFLPLEENAFLAVGHHGKATEPDEPVVFRITTDF